MSDRHRIVTLPEDGRAPVVLADLAVEGEMYPTRDTFTITPPPKQPLASQRPGRWGGHRVVGESHDNGQISVRLLVKGTTADEALERVSDALSTIDAHAGDVYYELRPDGASRSTYFELRGPASYEPGYRAIQFFGARSMELGVSFPVAPLALGDRMDIWEDFAPRGNVLAENLILNPIFGLGVATVDGAAYWTAAESAGFTPGAGHQTVALIPSTTRYGYRINVTQPADTTSRTSGMASPVTIATNAVRCKEGDEVFTSAEFVVSAWSSQAHWTARVDLFFYDATGAQIGSVSGPLTSLSGGGAFTRITNSAIAPAGAVAVRSNPEFRTATSGASIDGYITNGQITIDADPGVSVDGDTDRGEWTGAAHVSTSRLRDAGALDDFTATLLGGTLRAASGRLHRTAAVKDLAHTGRGYGYGDAEVCAKGEVESVSTNADYLLSPGLALSDGRRIWATNENTNLRIYYYNGASNTSLAIVGGLVAPVVGDVRWLRLRKEGNVYTAEWWTTEPTPGGTPTLSISTTLTESTTPRSYEFESDLTPHLISWMMNGTATAFYDDFRVQPYTYASRNLPDTIDLRGIPGDAPALMDLVTDNLVGTMRFGCVGWGRAAPPHNLVHNGDFDAFGSTHGWSVAFNSGIHAAATSISITTAQKKFGTTSAEIVSTATTDAGADFRILRRFRKGVKYTGGFWARSTSQTTLLKAELGVSGDLATGTGIALSPTWQWYSVEWTPAADRGEAYITSSTGAATATTWQIDGVVVYEGDVAPSGRHGEGAGALPPIGVLESEYGRGGTGGALAALTVTADTARNGYVLRWALSGANTHTAWYYIDPALLDTDEFTDSVTLEVFMRHTVPTTAGTPLVRVAAFSAEAPSAQKIYTVEHGTTGKSMKVPSVVKPQLSRLGSLTIPTGVQPGRWVLEVRYEVFAGASGNWDSDYLFIAPARRRAASASGKQSGLVPPFLNVSGERKRTRSDLSATSSAGPSSGEGPSPGLGGAPFELPAGGAQLAMLLSGWPVPDDPSFDGTGSYDDGAANKAVTVHAALTPRWRLARDG